MDRYFETERLAELAGVRYEAWPLDCLEYERARLFQEMRRLWSGPAMEATADRYNACERALKAARG